MLTILLSLVDLAFAATATGTALGGRLGHGPLLTANLELQPVLSPDGAYAGLNLSGRW